MTDRDAKEIRDVWAKATPGGWRAMARHLTSGRIVEAVVENDSGVRILTQEHPSDQQLANLLFFARSHQDVPALLAEVDRLRGENAGLAKLLANMEAVFANDMLNDDERTRVIYQKAKYDLRREQTAAGEEMLRKMQNREPPFDFTPVEPEG